MRAIDTYSYDIYMQAPPLNHHGAFSPLELFGSGGILSMLTHGYALIGVDTLKVIGSDTPLRSLAAAVLAHAIVLSFVAVDVALVCGHLLACAAEATAATIAELGGKLGSCK
jgi:hypothetical protein